MELSLNPNFSVLSYDDLVEIDGGVNWADLAVAGVCFVAGIAAVICPPAIGGVIGLAATCLGGGYGIVRAFDN